MDGSLKDLSRYRLERAKENLGFTGNPVSQGFFVIFFDDKLMKEFIKK